MEVGERETQNEKKKQGEKGGQLPLSIECAFCLQRRGDGRREGQGVQKMTEVA